MEKVLQQGEGMHVIHHRVSQDGKDLKEHQFQPLTPAKSAH